MRKTKLFVFVEVPLFFLYFCSKTDLESKEQAKYDHLRNQVNKRNTDRLNFLQDNALKEANKIVKIEFYNILLLKKISFKNFAEFSPKLLFEIFK